MNRFREERLVAQRREVETDDCDPKLQELKGERSANGSQATGDDQRG